MCPHCGSPFKGWLPHPNPLLREKPTHPFLVPLTVTLRAPNAKPGVPSVSVEAVYSESAAWLHIPRWIVEELGLEGGAHGQDRKIEVEIEGQVAVIPYDIWWPDEVVIGGILEHVRILPMAQQRFVLGPSETVAAEAARVYREARAAKDRSVLVLGEDTTRLPVLRRIQGWLRHHDYTSMLVKDLADIEQQSVEEKVLLLASLARFVVCDDATASGHIDELRILSGSRVPTAILNPIGAGGTWMQADYERDFSFMRRFEYRDEPDETLHELCRWAEQWIIDRRAYLDGRYPWR